MNVVFSGRAENDFEVIGDWIAQDDPVRADSFVDKLREACLDLRAFPNRYPPAPEFGPGIHKRTYGNYLILYRVRRDITIVSIRHAARQR